jgi:hypothetical protein
LRVAPERHGEGILGIGIVLVEDPARRVQWDALGTAWGA